MEEEKKTANQVTIRIFEVRNKPVMCHSMQSFVLHCVNKLEVVICVCLLFESPSHRCHHDH